MPSLRPRRPACWYGIYPLHQIVFAGMLRSLVAAAEREERGGGHAAA